MKLVLNIEPKDPKYEIGIRKQVDAVVAQLNKDINGTISVEEFEIEATTDFAEVAPKSKKAKVKKGGSHRKS